MFAICYRCKLIKPQYRSHFCRSLLHKDITKEYYMQCGNQFVTAMVFSFKRSLYQKMK